MHQNRVWLDRVKEDDLMNNIINKRNCVGCGICAVSCPMQCIEIELDTKLSYRPEIDHSKCVNCGICAKICCVNPLNKIKLAKEAAIQSGYFGFSKDALYYQGCTCSKNEYMQSASGGVLTSLLKRLLRDNEIDAVIHAKSICESGYKPLGICAISRTESEIDEGKGSFYGPIEFFHALNQVNEDHSIQNIAIVCIPCVANSIANLRKVKKNKGRKIKYVFTLMCGHNVNGRHGLMMLDDYPKSQNRILNMREKENLKTKDSYNISVSYVNGEKIIKPITSRFKTVWRGFINAEEQCSDCMDFGGHTADASFKDAWNFEPLKYTTGESVFVVRNENIHNILIKLYQDEVIVLKKIDRDELLKSQWSTVKERYYNALRLSETASGNIAVQIGYSYCRLLKKIAAIISGKPDGRINIRIQLLMAAILGKLLSVFARLTNDKK